MTTVSISEAQLMEISRSPTWHALVGYNNQQCSSITSSSFFFAPEGNTNPLEELKATLALFSQTQIQSDDSPQCQYRGRYVWLARQLPFADMGISPVFCPQFDEFSAHGRAKSLSLIFVTGFLGNPASYYGHLLLKINTSEQAKLSNLENVSINFGAMIPPDENVLVYIIKGLFGGYDSSFTQQQYYFHTHNYGDIELRDLWEYELNLSPEENELLIAHLWELIGKRYRYYFFNRNCAYRMGELLQIVIGGDIVNPLRLWETPQAIMQHLSQTQHGDQPLVKEIRFLPSRQSRLYQRYGQLNAEEKSVLKGIIRDFQMLDQDEFMEQPLESKYRVLDTLMDYYQFMRKDEEQEQDINNSYYRSILAKRYYLPPGDNKELFSSTNQPHLGRRPSYVNSGIIYNKDLGESLVLWLRPAYYDSLDSGYGHIQNTSLSMGEFLLLVNDSQVRIKELNLMKIENLNRNLTRLPGDWAHSWYLTLGAQQQSLACNDCLAAKANSGIGFALSAFGDKIVMGAFAGGGYWGNLLQEDALHASASCRLNVNLTDKLGLRAEAEHREFIGSCQKEQLYQIQARATLGAQSDLRFYFSSHRGREVGLSMGIYW